MVPMLSPLERFHCSSKMFSFSFPSERNTAFVNIGFGKKCHTYTYVDGPDRFICNGFQRHSLEECLHKCSTNSIPGNCPRKVCTYAIHYENNWCHLADSNCSIFDTGYRGVAMYRRIDRSE